MAFARSKSYKFLPSNPANLQRGTRIRRPSEVSMVSAPADQRPEGDRPIVGKAMYHGGRLSRQHRARLHKIFTKQEKKLDLAAKYEAKFNEKLPEVYTTSKDGHWKAAVPPSKLHGSESTPVLAIDGSRKSESLSNQVEGSVGHEDNDERIDDFSDVNMYAASDCSEPPRTKLVEQKKKGSGQLDWVSIIRYKQEIAKIDEDQERSEERRLKEDFRKSLEDQIKDRKKRRQKLDAMKAIERDAETRKLEVWAQEEEVKRMEQLEMRKREKEIRNQQNEQIKAAKERRAERRRRRDLALLTAARRECEIAKQKALEKKQENRKKMEEMQHENEIQERLKREEAVKQAEEELERQKVYNQMVEKQEKDRQEFYSQTAKKQEQNMQALVTNTSEAAEAAKQEELRILAEQLQYELKKDEEEKRKKEKQRDMNEAIAIELSNQVRNRAAHKREAIEQDRKFRQQLIANSKLGEEREKREAQQRRSKLQEQAEFLERQMEEVELRKQLEQVSMSDTEVKLNSDMLRRIEKWEIVPSNASGFRPRPY